MFGLGTLFTRSTSKDTVKSSVSSPSPIMIGDFVGTYSNDNPTITPTSLLYSSPSGIITLELLQNYNNKNFQLDKIYNNGIIGKCDGEFPVTNPVKNNVYYYSVDKKYYRCKNGSTSVIDTPDDNFEEISLYNLSLNGTGGNNISSIEITGDVNGTGILDDSSGVINITSSLSNMSKYVKTSYSSITTSDTPITAIAKLEGGLDNKANTSGSYPNLTVGTANKVLNSLTLSLNGESQTAFNGNAAVMIDITAEKIGAATTNHDHSGVYQPVGNYSVVGHKHTKSDISDMPTTLPNPNALTLKVGSVSHSYNGSSAKSIDITTESIGAQPKGEYALSSHNHNGTYAPISHTHTINQIGALTGYVKASSFASIVTTDTILTAIGKLEKGLDTKQNSGSYALSNHNHDSVYSKIKHSHGNTDITSIDASKITSGVIDIARLPAAALERLIEVENDTARFKLTKKQVQNGDTVKVTETLKMYRVIDDSQLSSEAGYTEYSVGLAASVPWSGVTGKPNTFTPSAHKHTTSEITNFPSSMKNPYALSIQLNGGTANVYDGSSAKTLNITPGSIGAQVAGSYALSNHNHSGVYAPVSHNHTIDQIGKLTGYAKASSAAAINVTDTILIALGKLEKSLDGKQASGSYAAASHKHTKSQITDFPTSMKNPNAITISLNGVSQGAYDGSAAKSINITPASIGAQVAGSYAAASHTHGWDAISGKPSTFTPSGHNQASNTITAMTGYAKATAVAAISATDSLNVAIGKLEKALDGKQASGSYALSNHNHSGVYAPVSHGTHVTYATATPLAPGSASVGTSAKVAREDHVHPLQTSVSGNAGSATVLATARTINGTSFNGSANITTATWGTARTLTIGNSGKSVNGSANVTWTLNEIGAARGYEVSGTTAATANWYRIAQSGSGIGNNIGLFLIQAAVSGKHSSTLLSAGISYGAATLNLDQLSHNSYNGSDGISKVRIVYHATYSGNKAYLEVYVPDAAARTIKVQMLGGNLGWTLVTPSTTGSIPSGYTSKEITLYDSKIVSYGGFVGSLSGNASTASALATARTITLTGDVTGSVSFNGSANVSITTTVGNDSHSHSWGNITGKPSTFTPSGHNQASNTITAMTGYAKASAVAAISASDTLNVAIGKLEKALDGKQAAGSYALSSHSHSWSSITGKPSSFAPSAHNQASNTITAMTGYAKASTVAAIAATDSLNVAIGKLEKALDSKQAAGSYAAASHSHSWGSITGKPSTFTPSAHTHDDRYFTESEINSKLSGYQPKGSYAAASHTHAYLPTSGGTISGALTVTGQILSNADVVAYSDARFKTNLQVIDNPINKILSINGYKYDMLGVDNGRQVGVIAQEIEQILPEAVYKDQNGHLGVRYTNLIPLLIEGFKQQQKEIQLLKRQLGMEV